MQYRIYNTDTKEYLMSDNNTYLNFVNDIDKSLIVSGITAEKILANIKPSDKYSNGVLKLVEANAT